MNQFELKFLDFIQDKLSCDFLDKVMPVITKLSDGGVFWIALAVILIIFKKTRKTGISMGLALIFGLLIGNVLLKNIVGRTRPYELNPEFNLLVKRLKDASFPSGHTLAAFEGAVTIFIRNKKYGIPAIILAFLIAFSRIYLYVHFPTDVLAGIIIGSVNAILACLIIDKLYKKYFSKELK